MLTFRPCLYSHACTAKSEPRRFSKFGIPEFRIPEFRIPGILGIPATPPGSAMTDDRASCRGGIRNSEFRIPKRPVAPVAPLRKERKRRGKRGKEGEREEKKGKERKRRGKRGKEGEREEKKGTTNCVYKYCID